MAPKKVASKSSVASSAYMGPITHNRSKWIIQKQYQGFVIVQSILIQLMESSNTRIIIKKNPLYDNSDSASSKSKRETYPNVMSVMIVDVTGLDFHGKDGEEN